MPKKSKKSILKKSARKVSFPAKEPQESSGQAMADQVAKLLEHAKHHLIGNKNLSAASELFRLILSVDPGNFHANFMLGQIELDQSNFHQAASHLEKASNTKGAGWQAHYLLGKAQLNSMDFSGAARTFFQAASMISPDSEKRYHLLSRVVSEYLSGRYDPALEGAVLSFLLNECDWTEQKRFFADCQFRLGYPKEYNEAICERIAIPLIKALLDRHEFRQAHDLHAVCLRATACAPETAEQWAWFFDRVNPLFNAAGEACRKGLPPITLPMETAGPTKIAFIIDWSVSFGSGLEMMLNILDDFSPAKARNIQPFVYSVAPTQPSLISKCRTLGIPLADFDIERGRAYEDDDLLERLVAVRQRSIRDGITVVAFFSTYEGFTCFASSVGLAPIQIFMSLGFFSLEAPHIHEYFAWFGLSKSTKIIQNRPWRIVPFPFAYPFAPIGSTEEANELAEISSIRGQLLEKYTAILGTIARPAKFTLDFIQALSQILRQNPGAVFLWFGFGGAEEHAVREMMKSRGIGDRCLYLGWVDTKIYCRVLDIHLDCFGSNPTGLTMAETFSAGGAYVLMRGDKSSHLGMTAMLIAIAEGDTADPAVSHAQSLFVRPGSGENLMMLSGSIEEYVAHANKLIADTDFRLDVGKAARQLMDGYLHDSGRLSEVLNDHLVEIVEDHQSSGRPNGSQPQ